jgi:hypothetical protein
MSQIAQGQPLDPSMFKEWYDYGVWSKTLREHLASPEFLKYDPNIQMQFEQFYELIQHAQIAQAQTQMQRQAPLMAEAAATQGSIAKVAQAHGPQEEPDPSQPQKSGDDSASPDWHRADGTFATADEIAQITAQIAAEAAPVDDPAAPKPEHVVQLRRRDGTTRDVVIEDPELAEEIRTNANDGMRRREFLGAKAAVEARESVIAQAESMIEHNPEGFVKQNLTDEQQVRLGVMLLSRHFDALVPIIQKFDQDPNSRFAATAESEQLIRTQSDQLTTLRASQTAAATVRQAVAALIPDTADQTTADEFWSLASILCVQATNRGERVTPETVPQILASTLKRFGFDGAGSSPAPASMPRIISAPSTSTPSPAAQPANTAAKALADAKAVQKRIRLRQQQRINAAAVPPAGAGAAPVRVPAIAPGTSIKDASKPLKAMNGWADFHS